MKSTRVLILVLSLSILSGLPVRAGGVPYVETITPSHIEEVSLFILPDGTGSALNAAQTFGGAATDARLTVRIVDSSGYPIPYFPWDDMWLTSEAASQYSCIWGGFLPGNHTDANGEVTFSRPLAGGGSSEGPLWFYLYGQRANYTEAGQVPPVLVRFNSADINADGAVDLADVPLFAGDFYGPYAYRSDFHWDGVLNLSDLTKLSTSLGSSCP